MNIKVYILKLRSGRLYVGQSTDPRRRLLEHQAGKGANICKGDPPVEILKELDTGETDGKMACAFEDFVTISIMQKLGALQAAGGIYCAEQYRHCQNQWLKNELYRLREWLNKLAKMRRPGQYEIALIEFYTWLEGYSQ